MDAASIMGHTHRVGRLRGVALFVTVTFAVVSAACSRTRQDPATHDTAALAASTAGPRPDAAPSASAIAPVGRPPPRHSMMLPRTAFDRMRTYSPELAVAPGQEPSAEHPAGTVYVAEQAGTFTAPFTVSEWDLASGQSVRQVALPVDAKDSDPALIYAGGRLHLMAWGSDHQPYYFQLTPSLEVAARSRVTGMAGSSPNALASDGTLTVVVARHPTVDGAIEFASCFAATYDGAGKPVANRSLERPGEDPSSASLEHNAAVADGHVYVLQHAPAGLRLLQLDASLRETAERLITAGPDWVTASLRAEGDHLVLDLPPDSFPISLDLSRISPASRGAATAAHVAIDGVPCGDPLPAAGSLYALLCGRTDGTSFIHLIAWDRPEP